jgi:transposase
VPGGLATLLLTYPFSAEAGRGGDGRARRPGRKPASATATCRRPNVVERCINCLKQRRAVTTRYEKWAVNDRAAVFIAALMIWSGA